MIMDETGHIAHGAPRITDGVEKVRNLRHVLNGSRICENQRRRIVSRILTPKGNDATIRQQQGLGARSQMGWGGPYGPRSGCGIVQLNHAEPDGRRVRPDAESHNPPVGEIDDCMITVLPHRGPTILACNYGTLRTLPPRR